MPVWQNRIMPFLQGGATGIVAATRNRKWENGILNRRAERTQSKLIPVEKNRMASPRRRLDFGSQVVLFLIILTFCFSRFLPVHFASSRFSMAFPPS